MGRTLIRGLLDSGQSQPSQVVAGARRTKVAERVAQEFGIVCGTDNAALVRDADLVLLCLKPKNLCRVANELAAALAPEACVVSIAAGIPVGDLQKAVGAQKAVVRAMPNTPCQVQAGMTVLCPGPNVSAEQLQNVRQVFAALGRVRVLEEEYINAVTGLSASGPAFIYLVIEALTDGGVMTGLPRDVAVELAAQTVHGAAQMVLETDRHPAALKDEVTTPAGCTISALLRLEDGKLRSVLARGVQEAALRASNLATSSSSAS